MDWGRCSSTSATGTRNWLKRLERQLATTGDEQLAALIDEIASYPVPEPEHDMSEIAGSEMLGPVKVRAPDGDELSFFGMFASFDERGRDLSRTPLGARDQGEAE